MICSFRHEKQHEKKKTAFAFILSFSLLFFCLSWWIHSVSGSPKMCRLKKDNSGCNANAPSTPLPPTRGAGEVVFFSSLAAIGEGVPLAAPPMGGLRGRRLACSFRVGPAKGGDGVGVGEGNATVTEG